MFMPFSMTEHWTLNSIAIHHKRSCIWSSQLLLFIIMKQTRRWSVRFIHHSVIETNLAARRHNPIVKIKSNCEPAFLCAQSFWAWKKGSTFFQFKKTKKKRASNIITIIFFASRNRKKCFDKKQNVYYRLSPDLHPYLLPNNFKHKF